MSETRLLGGSRSKSGRPEAYTTSIAIGRLPVMLSPPVVMRSGSNFLISSFLPMERPAIELHARFETRRYSFRH